mmetsp:Transcript_13581/g.31200  ORF Transcript_13581/g.31200 Transcript_13581/m.31200 type:complete len:201 (+) Transcript_13581:565-1167(+)
MGGGYRRILRRCAPHASCSGRFQTSSRARGCACSCPTGWTTASSATRCARTRRRASSRLRARRRPSADGTCACKATASGRRALRRRASRCLAQGLRHTNARTTAAGRARWCSSGTSSTPGVRRRCDPTCPRYPPRWRGCRRGRTYWSPSRPAPLRRWPRTGSSRRGRRGCKSCSSERSTTPCSARAPGRATRACASRAAR